MVVADLEAGVGTLSRMPSNGIDVLVVVAEPTLKSVAVAKKIIEAVRERHRETTVILAGNKVVDSTDEDFLEEHLPDESMVTIPFDRNIVESERSGQAPLDRDPRTAAITAISRLADLLDSRVTTAPAT